MSDGCLTIFCDQSTIAAMHCQSNANNLTLNSRVQKLQPSSQTTCYHRTPLQEVKISRQQRWAELYKILWSPCAAHLRIYGGREGAWVWASELPPVNRLCPAVCQAQGGRKHFYLQKDPDDSSSQTMHRYFRPPVRARYPERGVASYCYHTMQC